MRGREGISPEGDLSHSVLLEGLMHATAIRGPFEFDIFRGPVCMLLIIEPHISSVLASRAEKRAVLILEAIVGEVVVLKAVGL